MISLTRYGHKPKVFDLRECREADPRLWSVFRETYYDTYGDYPKSSFSVDDVVEFFNQLDLDLIEKLEAMEN